MAAALIGPSGFYRAITRPAEHFSTSPMVSPAFADALISLARECGLSTVVDLGAGGGELASTIAVAAPELRVLAVDIADRPAHLAADIEWLADPPPLRDALLVANEWLDTIPVDCAQSTSDGLRYLLVDERGNERPGPALELADLVWCERWWPTTPPGRVEIGRTRDEAWAELVRTATGSVLIAIDYHHTACSRPPDGTLTGYRRGRRCTPIPDGTVDITAHVALDSVARAGIDAGAYESLLRDQRNVLRAFNITVDLPAPGELSYPQRLAAASRVARLLDPCGLGGFGWLLQSTGPHLPAGLSEANG